MLSPQRVAASLICTALILTIVWCASPAAATDFTIGSGCTSGGGSARNDNGNNTWCNGSTWQYPFYTLGTAAASAGSSCSGYPAGTLRYNTTLSNVEMCDGSNWQFLAASTSACGTPSGLSFTNVTNATLNTMYTSSAATVTFSGCTGGGLSVSVTGAATAQISINGGTWTTSGSISSGQTLKVRLTSSGSVSTGLTATVTVGSSSTNWTVTTRSGSLNVFATAGTYVAYQIGGLSGANTICQTEANTAGYSGTYVAIMSSDTVSAASNLTLSYPIVNAYDGTTVASTNLWSGTISNVIKTPSGGAHPFCSAGAQDAFTGTSGGGAIVTGDTCTSWSSSSGNAYAGNTGATNSGWAAAATQPCTYFCALYCIQQ